MKRILVVDDEEVLCELYSEVLRDEGYEVIATSDGEGLMALIDQQFPLIAF